jgi:transcriptional regulatory protein LevR
MNHGIYTVSGTLSTQLTIPEPMVNNISTDHVIEAYQTSKQRIKGWPRIS